VPHLDPDRLVLIALGEQDPSASESEHLQGSEHLRGCAACGAELDATRATVAVGRETQHVRDLPDPPDDMWARIAEAAFAAPAPPNGRAGRDEMPARSASPGARSRRRLMVAAAAVVLLIAAVGVTITWATRRTPERIVAEADLVAQPAAPTAAKGRATIVDTGHGLQLRLSMSGMPTAGGYYAVWLYDGRTVMIPLGSPGEAPLNVPATADDLTRFSIVDVSAQQLGQQQHGTSMLQGHLHP
jgi:anti-sigma-K factor RskA